MGCDDGGGDNERDVFVVAFTLLNQVTLPSINYMRSVRLPHPHLFTEEGLNFNLKEMSPRP